MNEHDDQVVVVERSGGWLSNTPWWLVSVGLHVVILLGATLVAIERLHAFQNEDDIVIIRSAEPQKLFDHIPQPPTTTGNKGAPIDDGVTADPTKPTFFDPNAVLGDWEESDDGEDHKQRKGEGDQFIGFQLGKGDGYRGTQRSSHAGVYDTMGTGVGGGAAGRKGGAFGGRINQRLRTRTGPPGKSPEDAVRLALFWLARHQGPDGGWSADGFSKHCVGGACGGAGDSSFDTGVTGLAVLAFLGAGYTPLSKDEIPDPVDPRRMVRFGETVKRGIQWLMSRQDPEGCVGERGSKFMYNHTVAALALSEAYGMTASQVIKEPAQKAIDFLIAAQNPGKAWRYSAKSGDNDTSVSGWAVMALKSAELSELSIPKSGYDGMIRWLDEATEQNGYYQVGYNARSTGKVYVPGKNEQFDHHPSMSAVAVMSRIFIQKNKREPALTAVTLLVGDLPEWKQNKVDFYYWYYAALALFQYDGPSGPMWSKWNEPMKNAIVPHQNGSADGCRIGSWDPEHDRWGFEGGRVYAAAINALTLEVYYRYANVFGGGASQNKR